MKGESMNETAICTEPNLQDPAVAKLVKDREHLISVMRDTVPFATENGDEAALTRMIEVIEADEEHHFLSYSQEANHSVSFATRPQHKFDNARRTRTTLGRYVRRNLNVSNEELSSIGLGLLTDRIFGTLASEDADETWFTIVHGDAILQAYADSLGGNSCMTGESPDASDSTVALYAVNPNVVGLLLYRGPGLPEYANGAARALLWTCPCGTRILDRIYPNNGTHVDAMRQWAKRQGIVNRLYESMPDDGERVGLSDGKSYSLRLKMPHNGNVPYLDTFHWGERGISWTRVSTDPCDEPHMFDSTCGSYSENGAEDNRSTCDHCGDPCNDDDLYTCGDNSYCSYCADRHTFTCARCDERHHNCDARSVGDETWCEDCADRHSETCSECNSVFDKNKDEIVNDLCSDCGSECKECGTRFLNDDLNYDGLCEVCEAAKDAKDAEDAEDAEDDEEEDKEGS